MIFCCSLLWCVVVSLEVGETAVDYIQTCITFLGAIVNVFLGLCVYLNLIAILNKIVFIKATSCYG